MLDGLLGSIPLSAHLHELAWPERQDCPVEQMAVNIAS